MSSSPLTVDPETEAAELARTMIDRELRSVPVIDADQLAEVVHSTPQRA